MNSDTKHTKDEQTMDTFKYFEDKVYINTTLCYCCGLLLWFVNLGWVFFYDSKKK